MTTHRRFVTLRSLLSAVCLAALAAGPAAAQTAPCPEGDAPTSVCTFVDDAAPYATFLEQACTRALMAGCGGDYACPGEAVLREDMAVHLERLYRGPAFTPAAACASRCSFADLTPSHCLASWICQLVLDDITRGCQISSGGIDYCGPAAVTRAQMAVFLGDVVARRRSETVPTSGQVCRAPGDCRNYACVQAGQGGGASAFADVASTHWACAYIHYIAIKGITSGCGVWQYCPDATIPRQEMAVFLVAADDLVKGTPLPATNPCQ